MRTSGSLTRAARAVPPGCFAITMATGVVSAALRSAGSPHLAGLLLVIAGASFAILLTASVVRSVTAPADLRADLTSPRRAFSCFAFVAACDVLGSRLAGDGHDAAAAALAVAALLAWACLTWLIPGRLIMRRPVPMALTDVGGSWYLWAVATQSLAIAATFVQVHGLPLTRTTPQPAVAAWTAGVVIYLAVTIAVVAKLLIAGLGPREVTAPYWVAMGAAAITVLAASQILGTSGSALPSAPRTAITRMAIAFWALATCLIPLLSARVAWRHLVRHAPLRYRPDLWMVVFPVGMYAVAGMRLGATAGLPLIQRIGTTAAWIAAVGWTLVVAAMIVSFIGWSATEPETAARDEPDGHQPVSRTRR